MREWLENIKNIINGNAVGVCPGCHSENTGYEFVEVYAPHGFIRVWCNDCGIGAVLDCEIPENAIAKTA